MFTQKLDEEYGKKNNVGFKALASVQYLFLHGCGNCNKLICIADRQDSRHHNPSKKEVSTGSARGVSSPVLEVLREEVFSRDDAHHLIVVVNHDEMAETQRTKHYVRPMCRRVLCTRQKYMSRVGIVLMFKGELMDRSPTEDDVNASKVERVKARKYCSLVSPRCPWSTRATR